MNNIKVFQKCNMGGGGGGIIFTYILLCFYCILLCYIASYVLKLIKLERKNRVRTM